MTIKQEIERIDAQIDVIRETTARIRAMPPIVVDDPNTQLLAAAEAVFEELSNRYNIAPDSAVPSWLADHLRRLHKAILKVKASR